MVGVSGSNICIITQTVSSLSSIFLKEELEKLGNKVTLLEYTNGRAIIAGNRLYHDGKELDVSQFDGVMKRTWGKEIVKAEKILTIFENNGVVSCNLSDRVKQANKKTTTQRMLERAGVSIPKGVIIDIPFMPSPDFPEQLKKKLGAPPYVVKSDRGGQGKGVVMASGIQEVMDIIRFNEDKGSGSVIQEYICAKDANDHSYHYSLFMINGNVAGARKLTAKDTREFRSNVAFGGSAHLIDHEALPKEWLDLTKIATKEIGLRVTGVDLIIDRESKKPYILESNESPVISSFNKVGLNMAKLVAEDFHQQIIDHKKAQGVGAKGGSIELSL